MADPHPTPDSTTPHPSLEELHNLIQESVETALKSRSPASEQGSTTWLTNEEAMDYLDVSRSTLNRYRMDGKLPYSKIGQKVFYRLGDIEEMLNENLRDRGK